jgi:hypothetical protein
MVAKSKIWIGILWISKVHSMNMLHIGNHVDVEKKSLWSYKLGMFPFAGIRQKCWIAPLPTLALIQ